MMDHGSEKTSLLAEQPESYHNYSTTVPETSAVNLIVNDDADASSSTPVVTSSTSEASSIDIDNSSGERTIMQERANSNNKVGYAYLQFIKWSMSSSLLKKTLKTLFLYPSEMPPAELTNAESIINARRIDYFVNGLKLATEKLWPLLFTGMLTYDGVTAVLKEEGMNFLSQLSWPADDNDYILNAWPKSWIWPASIVAVAVCAGIGNLVLKSYASRESNEDNANLISRKIMDFSILGFQSEYVNRVLADKRYQKISEILDAYQPDGLAKEMYDRTFSELEKSGIHIDQSAALGRHKYSEKDLQALKDEKQAIVDNYFNVITQENNKIFAGKKSQLEALCKLASNGSIARSYFTMQALAFIVYELSNSRLAKLPNDWNNKTVALKNKTLNGLQDISRNNKNGKKRLMANYILWKLGKPHRYRYEPLFLSVLLLKAIFKYRLWLSFMQFIKQYYITDNVTGPSAKCEDPAMKLYSMPATGDEECAICPPNRNVNYKNLFDAQNCINEFLSLPKTSVQVKGMLIEIRGSRLQQIDFSQQRWWEWSISDFKQIFNLIADSAQGVLQKFDLSVQSGDMVQQLDLKRESVLLNFFQKITVEDLRLNQCLLSSNTSGEIIYYISKDVKYLELSNMQLGSHKNFTLPIAIAHCQQLNRLTIDGNLLTDNQMITLAPALSSLSLTRLRLGNNLYHEIGLNAFSSHSFLNLTSIDFAGSLFSNTNMTAMSEIMKNPNLRELTISHCGLTDNNINFIRTLSETGILFLDLSYNDLTEYSAECLGKAVNGSKLEMLTVSHNDYQKKGICKMTLALARSNIKVFVASGCDMQDDGFVCTMQDLVNKATHIDVSNNGISEDGISYLPQIVNQTAPTKLLNLSHNPIKNAALRDIVAIFKYLEKTLQEIDLTNTQITELNNFIENLQNLTAMENLYIGMNDFEQDDYLAAVKKLVKTNLKLFNATQTSAFDVVGQAIMETIPHTNLHTVDLSHNSFGRIVAKAAIENLITPAPDANRMMSLSVSAQEINLLSMAKANTRLVFLSLSFDDMQKNELLGLCRIQGPSNISMSGYVLKGNVGNSPNLNVDSCYVAQEVDIIVSGSERLSPPGVYSVISNLAKVPSILSEQCSGAFLFFKNTADAFLDRLSNTLLDYSKDIAKECPSYFPQSNVRYWSASEGDTTFFNLSFSCANISPIISAPQMPGFLGNGVC